MHSTIERIHTKQKPRLDSSYQEKLQIKIKNSWTKIAPFWPLENLVAVNPLSGFEDLPFNLALQQGASFFQHKDLPIPMQKVNLESIKWMQAYFDYGQATLRLPRIAGSFLSTVIALFQFDKKITNSNHTIISWLSALPCDANKVISICMDRLQINKADQERFLTLTLTTLNGWASHVKYVANWSNKNTQDSAYYVSEAEYLAMRLVLICILWPQAKELLHWHTEVLKHSDSARAYETMKRNEHKHLLQLLPNIALKPNTNKRKELKAQVVFCIDVRSEPFRKALETQNGYETFGFAGFFGLPIKIEDPLNSTSYASCPVLLTPKHDVQTIPTCAHSSIQHKSKILQALKSCYNSVKHNFTTPFFLAEALGALYAICMLINTFKHFVAVKVKETFYTAISQDCEFKENFDSIPMHQQINYALNALRMIGLTNNFALVVIFAGHGSSTNNNAYASGLDCGACGGHSGAPNARVLANILNNPYVHNALRKHGINIPATTHFIGALHNTTTDELTLYEQNIPESIHTHLDTIKADMQKARLENCLYRSRKLQISSKAHNAVKSMLIRSIDWSQVRPEWGLANNASFIIGPRFLTENCTLNGRSFLHSYDWSLDHDESILTTILTAPVIVAQWINSQYLFSTLDNVAYGGGSKITKNITGKFAIMQGNASDLMTGLPLQSVYESDTTAFHELNRLCVIIYAPRNKIAAVVAGQQILQKLFGNAWMKLVCIDPLEHKYYQLETNFEWTCI